MKKFTFLFLSTFIIASAFAQSPWWVGGRLGVNFTTVSGKWNSDDDSKHKFIVTPLIGAVGMYSFTDMIAVSMELNMAKSGALYVANFTDEGGEDIEIKFRERYTTINIPVLARFTFGTEWQFFAYGGFYWSKILCGKYVSTVEAYDHEQSGKIKFGDEPENYDGDDWYLSKDENRRMDFGLNLGGGVQKQIGPGMLVLDLRFGMGFCDSNKWPDKDDKPDGYKAFKNRSINLTLAYNFNFQ